MSVVGATLYHGTRKVVITGEYNGDSPDDPPGYYYRYDGETKSHWISAGALPIRFTKEPSNG
jgi:hypothetical protein